MAQLLIKTIYVSSIGAREPKSDVTSIYLSITYSSYKIPSSRSDGILQRVTLFKNHCHFRKPFKDLRTDLLIGVYFRYEWKGKLEEDNELLMIFKTKSEHLDALKTAVMKNHPYEVPEFIALPVNQLTPKTHLQFNHIQIEYGNESYLQWINTQLKRNTSKDVDISDEKQR